VSTAEKQTYADAQTKVVATTDGLDYAYRDVGSGPVPLVLLQHFRGNLDNWDPALIDALASGRRVVAFDNAGVGGSKGLTPNTIGQMATDAIAFLDAMEFDRVDILGFSIGSFVAQDIALTRPVLVRNLLLASSAPKGGSGMHGWAPWVIDAVGKPRPDPVGYLKVFFANSVSSQQAGAQAAQPHLRQDRQRRRADDLADTTGPVRRGVRVGPPESRTAATTQRNHTTGVHRQR
jgi:pimeloyl-ACP methyl ester carboxylesterase